MLGQRAPMPNLLGHRDGQKGHARFTTSTSRRGRSTSTGPAEPACHHQEQSQGRQGHGSAVPKTAVAKTRTNPHKAKTIAGENAMQTTRMGLSRIAQPFLQQTMRRTRRLAACHRGDRRPPSGPESGVNAAGQLRAGFPGPTKYHLPNTRRRAEVECRLYAASINGRGKGWRPGLQRHARAGAGRRIR